MYFVNLKSNLALKFHNSHNVIPPVSKASREVANFTERKNPHTKTYMVSKICLSVCYILQKII